MRVLAQKQNQLHASSMVRPGMSVTARVKRHDPDPLSLQRTTPLEYDLSRVPLHPPAAGIIQANLSINVPGDEYEREAGRVAGQVLRMPDPDAIRATAMSGAVPKVQRKCSCGRTCDKCAAEQDHDHEQLQMKRAGPGERKQTTQLPVVHQVLRSPGQPLDRTTRAWFEPRFGHDFSRVRVHADAQGDAAARSLGARAFTVGRTVVFAADAPSWRMNSLT
jgi:hypothetical protein